MRGSRDTKPHQTFLKTAASAFQELSDNEGLNAKSRARYRKLATTATALRKSLNRATPTDAPAETDIGDTSDLPKALLKELNSAGSGAQDFEKRILSVMTDLGGEASLDQILVALYRKHQMVTKRRVLQNKLWRLVRKNRLQTVKDDRGVFRLKERDERGKRTP
ncbi:MAG TPA: hypothetical protein VHL34_04685 [Rhizomicrobium sp.]|nr:hypothetical protein [Rhizomicrobium sp.]